MLEGSVKLPTTSYYPHVCGVPNILHFLHTANNISRLRLRFPVAATRKTQVLTETDNMNNAS